MPKKYWLVSSINLKVLTLISKNDTQLQTMMQINYIFVLVFSFLGYEWKSHGISLEAKIDIDHDIPIIWTISCVNHEATGLSVAL